ncbi:hypothetical protein [Kribbella sp. NPDC004536]|uniref:WXG100-like domain-containing protein n=1 Tax=Kribbella sp. NPDC004536 TaxID=3364106 RepID=UPI0036774906
MSIWHPIVEFLGAIVGVDPDDWPQGDEDALREYARQYDAIAAELRATVAGGCREASTAIGAAWNGEAGRALAAQVLAYGTDKDFGGAESIAAAAADLAQYLRDQADTIVRTKVLIIAQIAIGILMFAIPAGKAISLGMRQAFRQALKDFIHNGAKNAMKKAVAALTARAAKTAALTPARVVRGLALAAVGAGAYGLAPNTIAQTYGVLTNQSGRTGPDGTHEDGWNWDETKKSAEIAAVATPLAIASSIGLGRLGGLAARKVDALNGRGLQFLGRRAAGATSMAVSMPAANSLVVTHKLPTFEEVWKSAVMGAAVLGGGSHSPHTDIPPHAEPVEVAAVRDHSTIGGDHRPPDPPQQPVKPALESSHAETNVANTNSHSTGAESRTETGAAASTQQAAVATAPEAATAKTPEQIAKPTTQEKAATAARPVKPEAVKDWTQRQEHRQEVQRREANANTAHADHEATVEKARAVKETEQAAKHADKELKTAERVLQKHESKHGKADDSSHAVELRERVAEAQAHHKTAHEELTAAKHAEAEVATTKLAAETHRLSYLTAKLDYVMSRLSPVELRHLSEGKLDVLKDALGENVTRDEALQLSIHELIHRTEDGWGFALKSTQLHAELALREDLLVQMGTGEGKTAVAAVALGMIAADRPVHFMTSNRSLSAQAYAKFRKVLEPLGYDVIHVDPAVRYGKPRGRTVYVGDVASFGWAMGRGHRVPGKDVIVDEVDAVAVELAAQRYTHSSGAAGKASAKTEAQVMLAKWALDSGKFDHADLGLTSRGEPINGKGPELTAEGRQKLAELTGVDPAARQFAKQVTRLENAAQARWGLREGRDYIRATIGDKETVLIVSKHSGEPLVDRETLLEQRWTDVAQALEAQHGLEVRADPSHTNAVTTRKLLDSYEHVSGMSGTAKQAEQAIRDLYGKDKVGRVVEIDRFNDPKLESRPPQHFATIEEKYRAIVDQAIADLAKNGDPSTGRPQAIVTEHNDEVALVQRLLNERLKDLPGVRIEVVNAERMAGFIADRTFDAEMGRIWKQAGERGTITIGNKVLGRGIDIELAPDAFQYGDRPDADARVFTGRNGREAVSGGLAVRVGFHDAESPRGTIQALNRAGRQGAPGEASLYASHQDELFRRHPDALEAAAAYIDNPTVASRNKYLTAVESAQLASQAATLSALGVTHTTAPTPELHDDTARNRRVPGDSGTGYEPASDIPGVLQNATSYQGLSAADQDQVVDAIKQLTGNDSVLIEGLRPLLESPGLRTLEPAELLAEVRGWRRYDDLFGRAVELGAPIAGSPDRVPVEHWSSYGWADATDLGEPDVSEPLSTSGRPGQIVTLDENSGVYSIRRDGSEWIVKLFPDRNDEQQRQEIADEFGGVVAAAGTGYGPTPYGLVRAHVGDKRYLGMAMSRVRGAMVHDPQPSGPDAVEEVARARRAVTFDTVLQLHQYLARLLDDGYHSAGELQPLVDPETGNLRMIDLADVKELLDDPLYQQIARADHGLGLESADIRDQLIRAAIENARREEGRARLLEASAVRGGMTVAAVEQAVELVRMGMRLPDQLALRFVVGANNLELVRGHGIAPAVGRRPGYFRMEDATGVVYLSAQDLQSPDDIRATVWHEVVGHFGWRLFSPEDRAAMLAEVHELRGLVPELSAEIEELYADQPPDVRAEEFLARLAEGEVPSRVVQAWNAVLAGRFGTVLHRIGAISNERLAGARHQHELEPLFGYIRDLVRAIRRNRPVSDASPVVRTRTGRPGPNIARVRPAVDDKYDGEGLPAFTTGLVERSYDDLLNGTADEQALAAVLPETRVKRFLVTATDGNHFEIEGARLTPHHLAVMTDLYQGVSIVLDGASRELAQRVADIMGVDVTIRTANGWETLDPQPLPAADGRVECGPDGTFVLYTKENPAGVPIELESHLGRLLGIGGSKAAFAFYDKVVLIALPTVEVSFFTQLDRIEGLLAKPGAAEVIAPVHYTTAFGRDAFVADRFPRISRDVWVSVPDFAAPDALRATQASLDSLLKIRAFMVANNVTIGDLQFGIDADGRFWVYDVGRVRPLTIPLPPGADLGIFKPSRTNPLEVVDAWIAWAAAGHTFTPIGQPRTSPAPRDDLQPPSYDWATATDGPATSLYPDTPAARERVVAELERAYVAARTGYGPVPGGLVTTEIDGARYVGFAVQPVEAAADAATLDTVLQVHEYVRRLHALGYYPAVELQGTVAERGMFHATDSTGLEPLPGAAATTQLTDRLLQTAFDNVKRASTGRDRRVHRDQPRGGAGSIHRSEFRGDGRRTPNPAAVWSAVERALPQVAAAVGVVHDVRAIAIAANRLTITFWGGAELTAELKVAGDFTNAGPVRWERTADSMHWATITLSPQVRDEVVGRALADAIAGMVAAYRGVPLAGRQAEVAYLVARIEQGEQPRHHRRELRLLLQHLGKLGSQLSPALQRRVDAIQHEVRSTRADELEDGWTDPAAFTPTQLPRLASRPSSGPDPAVDRFVHGLFKHFAKQPEVSPERGHSVSRLTVLREQPLLRQFVNWYGPDKAAELGRLDADALGHAISPRDRQSVAAAFDRLRWLLQQDGRAAARQFSELANALGVVAHEDLRAALPHDLAAAVHALKPSLLQRAGRAIDAGAKSIPGLRADLMFGFLETVPTGTASAAVLAGSGRVGLAAAVLTGAVVAVPFRTVVNRYVEAREEVVKSARRTYRRTLDESTRAPQRATLTNAIHTAHKHLQTTGPVVRRGELGVPETKVPALTTPWWMFPLRSSVPVAAAAIPMAMVVSPVVVGATIGLAVAVVGSAQYLFARHQATLDDERRTRDYQWRSWRQLVDELRSTADYLVRLEALAEQLGKPMPKASFAFEAPTDHTGRGVIPAKRYFAVRELLLGVVPMAHRVTSVYVQQQLATSTAAVLEALARLGTIGAVSGIVEAFHAEANRHAFDRRMHNWLELLRIEVQARADEINDPLLAQLDQLLTAEPQRTMAIPALPPWSPVLHSDREATTNRRWYAVGAAAIAGSGVGVAAWMVESFHLDPVYLWQAAAAGAFQPVTFYARYLRRRMRVKADLAERDRGAEQRAADELDRERAAAADAAQEIGHIADAIAGRTPRTRPAPSTELSLFVDSERRDDHGSAELSRLLNKLAGLDAERQRLLKRYDNGEPTELHELSGVLVAISTTLTQYADALHKLGVDPHIRLGGPQDRPVSDSVLHHDPIHARNLSDLTWAPGLHHKPSAESEDAALIAARIHLSTAGRYGPLSLQQIRAHATVGKLLTDIAADVVSAAERKPANALKARVEFLRTLTADQARAVPARLLQQKQIPIDWPTYALMRVNAIQREQTELITRAAARTETGAAGNDRHIVIAAACTTAAREGDRAREAWQTFRDNPNAATLVTAKQAEALYEQRLAESLPSKDVLQTAIVSGDLPHLTLLADELNHALSATGNTFRYTPELLHRMLRAETRPLLSPGGFVLTVGNDPRADVSELTQFELTLDPNRLREVLNHPVKFEEGQLGQLVQGGTGLATTTTQSYGFNGSLKLGPVLSALPDHNPLKAAAQIVSPSIEYSKNFGQSTTGGATEYGLPGSVEVIQGEILRFRSDRPRWSWRIRTSAVGAWSEPHVVAGTTDTLDLGISHAYTVGPPTDTVTIAETGGQRNTDLPEHVASRVDGLTELADRAITGLRQRLGRLDRIGHDQLRGLLTEDAPGRLAEATRPGGLTRPITSGGRVVAYAQLETTAVWEQVTLLGDSSKDHKIERLRVGFSGTSGGVTRSAGDSYAISADGMPIHDLHGSPWDLGPSGKVGRSTGHDVSVNTGDVAIHPSVQRVQPTIGLKLRLEHRLTIHRVDKRDTFTLTTGGDAVLRMPENEAFRYGVPVPAAAIVRGDDGQPTCGKDKRLVLRGDPQPQEQPLELPVWMNRIRGAGPALVQELTGADKVLKQFLEHLTGKGLIPRGDLGGKDPVLAASQLANLERVTQQLSRHRLETGYDIAAQEGILFRLDLHRTGRSPEQHTYRIRILPGRSEFVGLTTGETVVNLDIGSNTTSRSGSWSNSLPWQFKAGLGNKPQNSGQDPEGGLTGARTSLGRVISWGAGSTVNRVSLTESTAKVAVFEVAHNLVVTELTDESTPIAEAEGSARLSVDSEFCPTGADPAMSIDGDVDPLLLRSATFQAIDAGNPVARLIRVLPQLARADSSALHHLSAFLNPRNLAARPELLVAPYRTSLLVTPVPSNPKQAIVQRGITSGRARLTVTSTLRNLEYIGFGNPVNGEINLTLGSTTISTGTSAGGSVLVNGGDGTIQPGGTSYSGSLTGSGSTSRSDNRTETQINGVERLVIRTGQHYQFVAGLALTAQLQGAEKVELPDGTVMLTIPERDVLRLYGRGKLALPAAKVAEVVERLRDGKLELDKRTAVSVLTRYAADTQHNSVAPVVRKLVGLTAGAFSTLDVLLPAAKYLAEQHVEVKLPQFYTTTMGAAMIDESSVQDPDGHETDLYREVLAALDDQALEDPVLTAGLRGDLAGLRWHGHVDDLISPRGFVTEYPTAGGRQVTVRINLKYEGPITMRGDANANALTILQIYNYLEQSRSITRTRTYGGNAGGSFTTDAPRDGSVGTDRSTSTTASSTEQNTRITRALWEPTKRVSRGFNMTIQIDDATSRNLTGELTLLVPPSVIDPTPEQGPADRRTVTLPRGTVAEGTTAPTLFETVHERLSRPDMLTKAGVLLHRNTLENALSAATRMAAFERIATPDGYPLVRLPVPGHRSRMVAVQVRAEVSGMQLVADDTTQLAQIDRQQRTTQVTTSSTRMLPTARSVGTSNAVGVGVGASAGEQAGEKVNDMTGHRKETSMYERGPVVTVKVEVRYLLEYARLHLGRDGGVRTGRTDTAAVDGTAYLTMYRHEYDELCAQRRQEGLRPR